MATLCSARPLPLSFAVITLASVAFIGCGGDSGPTGSVSGKVYLVAKSTKHKQPITEGRVFFRPVTSQREVDGEIRADGSYDVTGVRVGPVKIRVEVPEEDEPDDEDATFKKAKRRRFSLPPDYLDPEATPLQIDVKEGSQPYDILVLIK